VTVDPAIIRNRVERTARVVDMGIVVVDQRAGSENVCDRMLEKERARFVVFLHADLVATG
jgi:hypothetical protein